MALAEITAANRLHKHMASVTCTWTTPKHVFRICSSLASQGPVLTLAPFVNTSFPLQLLSFFLRGTSVAGRATHDGHIPWILDTLALPCPCFTLTVIVLALRFIL